MALTRITGNDVRDGTVTDADVAAANKDGLAAVPSLRTLGTGPSRPPPAMMPDSLTTGWPTLSGQPPRWSRCLGRRLLLRVRS